VIEAAVRPRGPYSLRLSCRFAGDATCTFLDGVLTAALHAGSGPELVRARQLPDGTVQLVGNSVEGVERLRERLGLDADIEPFLRRFGDDALLGPSIHRLHGLRPPVLGTVAHALLRALCGQLIQSGRARAIERAVVRAATPALGASGLHAPPGCRELGRLAPAELRRLGLHARRSATLVRICRALDLERLRALPTDAVADRLGRERGLGPWSVGVICLQGLGRPERGLEGDLGLVKLLALLRGRPVEAWETAELLEPYGEWAGLASVYLLAGHARGLVPLPARAA
jgi:AraC family transcriptional regulator, regulatory protein of adaptative response / DNA-3-methyladenine glycosylase II